MSITDPVQINEKKINNQIREYARNLFFFINLLTVYTIIN